MARRIVIENHEVRAETDGLTEYPVEDVLSDLTMALVSVARKCMEKQAVIEVINVAWNEMEKR